MVNARRGDKTWHDEWRNKAPHVELSLPTDDALASAEEAMLDPSRNAADKKAAALRGVPTLVSSDVSYSMWIFSKDLTSSFSDTEIMTSLGSDPQPAIWSANVNHLRDFKAVRNMGVNFVCTDLGVAQKLGGQMLSICGKKFRIQPYSKYSNWYYVDLNRLPDEVDDSEIYDWFVEHGTPPVYLCPSRTIRGLQSRSRRVYFNQKDPPASLMITDKIPLRQIQFGEHGYAVVNHRIRKFNHDTPPFIQELREQRKARASPPQPVDRATYKAPSRASIDTGAEPRDMDTQEMDPDYVPSEPNGSDGTSEASSGSVMVDVEGAISVQPSSVWPSDADSPKFSTGSAKRSDRQPARVLRAKTLVFGEVAPPAVKIQEFPPSQAQYPVLASANQYEWLSEGDNGSVPPDQDLTLWDSSMTPPCSVASYVKLSKPAEKVLNSAVIKYSAEEVTLDQLCDIIESHLKDFSDTADADDNVYTLQAQPSVHRFLLDTAAPDNYQHLRNKATNHAILRVLSRKLDPKDGNYSLEEQVNKLFPDAATLNPNDVLQRLCPSADTFCNGSVHQARGTMFDVADSVMNRTIIFST